METAEVGAVSDLHGCPAQAQVFDLSQRSQHLRDVLREASERGLSGGENELNQGAKDIAPGSRHCLVFRVFLVFGNS